MRYVSKNARLVLVINGSIYRFQLKLGRVLDLAMFERKDV